VTVQEAYPVGAPQRRGAAPGASYTIDQFSQSDSQRGSVKNVHYKSLYMREIEDF
jgi:hypothetical protein